MERDPAQSAEAADKLCQTQAWAQPEAPPHLSLEGGTGTELHKLISN